MSAFLNWIIWMIFPFSPSMFADRLVFESSRIRSSKNNLWTRKTSAYTQTHFISVSVEETGTPAPTHIHTHINAGIHQHASMLLDPRERFPFDTPSIFARSSERFKGGQRTHEYKSSCKKKSWKTCGGSARNSWFFTA